MATDTRLPIATGSSSATSSWGLGDGQAIPWEYAPAPEARDIVTLKERYGLFIGGREVPSSDGATFVTIDPATEEPLASVSRATPVDIDKAVRAARRAQSRIWGPLSGRERAKYLFRISRILQERSREFAVLESMDSGKPIKESRDVDVPLAAAHFWYYAGWADKLDYAFPGRVAKPLGVAGQIIPWNFPLLMLAWKIAPALAAGNTVVLKPASTTPLTALLFAEVCQEADLPPGVVNIVPGPGEVGMSLVTHPGIDKVAFTGSTEIGRKIARGVAGTDKVLTLELGGKAANIVFDDAPLDQAIEGIVNGIYFNQGEVCCAGSRLLVQESIAETVIDKLKDRLATIRVGDPLDKNTDVGAINSKDQLARITELVASGVAEGAELYQPACDLPDRGYFFRPTLFTNVAQSHRIAREEIFGPVLSVLTFRTPDEAIEKANNTPYGLSAGVWTDKGSRILKMVSELRAGVVWANTFNRFDPTSPFGGYKESGFGREGGMHGLHAYVRLEDR
jgi:aldehyde dehydrogenase (NAD+)